MWQPQGRLWRRDLQHSNRGAHTQFNTTLRKKRRTDMPPNTHDYHHTNYIRPKTKKYGKKEGGNGYNLTTSSTAVHRPFIFCSLFFVVSLVPLFDHPRCLLLLLMCYSRYRSSKKGCCCCCCPFPALVPTHVSFFSL